MPEALICVPNQPLQVIRYGHEVFGYTINKAYLYSLL